MTAHGNKKFSFTGTRLIVSFTQGEHTFASVKSGSKFLPQNEEATSTMNSGRTKAQAVISGFHRGGPGTIPGQVMWDLW
jgi:hypothetical protein